MISCPTCKKPNCGNHAACARRASEAATNAMAEEEKLALQKFTWLAVWLYIGVFSAFDILTDIRDGEERQRRSDQFSAATDTEMMRFIVAATGCEADRRFSHVQARRIIERTGGKL